MTAAPLDCEADWLAAASLDDWHANVLCVGEIHPRRNLALAVLAFAEYRRAFDPFARLILAGPETDAAYAGQLRNLVHTSGLAGHVLMTDAKDASQLKALFLTADAVLDAGLVPDGTVSDQSGTFRVPVVTTASGNTPRKLAEALHGAMG